MNIRIICIGDELLSGDTVNTNLAAVADLLAQNGLAVSAETCVPDNRDDILDALRLASAAEAVILIGGLGPTDDDLTRPVTAEFLQRPLHLDAAVRDRIVAFLGARGRTMAPRPLDIQSQVPEGAIVLTNRNGTAPGLVMEDHDTLWALLPGPPRECIPMAAEQLLPLLLAKAPQRLATLTVRVCGRPESEVEAIAKQAIASLQPQPHFAICIKSDCIMLRLSLPDLAEHDAVLRQAYDALATAFGDQLLPEGCTTAAEYLGKLLVKRQLVMATAESCTGGGIAQTLTAIPGSSEWFVGGVVTYANEWKQNFLGVSAETLATVGAVSEPTVHQMLDGLRDRCGVPAGVAVSGIAGPGGGTPDKPVGTVVIGAFAPGWKVVRTMHYPGRRDAVRQRAISGCLNLLIQGLLGTAANH